MNQHLSPQDIKSRAQYWATQTVFDEQTRGEISLLLETKNDNELTERFYRDLEFGTGGLRGVLGAGTNRINIYNVRKATQALVTYLVKTHTSGTATPLLSDLKVAIAYDSRHFSKEFAQAAAEVIAGNGLKALITRELRPVPLLSFMVRHFNCHAGICITASHNPPEYNGFKVYWRDGGQLVPPHDKNVIAHYNAISDYASIKWLPFEQGIKANLISWHGDDLDEAYFSRIMPLSLNKDGRDNFKVVYSPLHGSGLYPVSEALKRFGFKDVHIVKEQATYDGSFPTVTSPNPEDPKAMAQALQLGKAISADLIMATDPDADRVGVIAKDGSTYVELNGNQIASLLCNYILTERQRQGTLPENSMIVKTIVTTDLLDSIAHHFQIKCIDTLTGFKWIGEVIENYSTGKSLPKLQFLCGGEESYGFLAGDFVRDKDAVITCALVAEMLAHYKSLGISVTSALKGLFEKFGVHLESLQTLTLKGKSGAEKISSMMNHFRKTPPVQLAAWTLTKTDDYLAQKSFVMTAGISSESATLTLPKSDVLQFYYQMGASNIKVSVRPSGTEPKIKFYFAFSQPKNTSNLTAEIERCQEELKRIEKAMMALCEKLSAE